MPIVMRVFLLCSCRAERLPSGVSSAVSGQRDPHVCRWAASPHTLWVLHPRVCDSATVGASPGLFLQMQSRVGILCSVCA